MFFVSIAQSRKSSFPRATNSYNIPIKPQFQSLNRVNPLFHVIDETKTKHGHFLFQSLNRVNPLSHCISNFTFKRDGKYVSIAQSRKSSFTLDCHLWTNSIKTWF